LKNEGNTQIRQLILVIFPPLQWIRFAIEARHILVLKNFLIVYLQWVNFLEVSAISSNNRSKKLVVSLIWVLSVGGALTS
jgi:hypothetical protein